MELASVRISDILKNEHIDFLEYCALAGKEFVGDLTSTDYVAYRTQFGVQRSVAVQIRCIIENYDPDTAAPNNIPAECPKEASRALSLAKEFNFTGEGNAHVTHLSQEAPKTPSENDTSTTFDKSEVDSETFSIILGVNSIDYDGISIDELMLSTRAYNALRRLGCKTIADVLRYTAEALRATKNIGKGSADEIFQKLRDYISGEARERAEMFSRFSFNIDTDMDLLLADVFNANNQVNTYGLSLTELDFSVRARNALDAANCDSISKLLSFTIRDLWELPNIGRTTIENIILGLTNYFAVSRFTNNGEYLNRSRGTTVSRNLRAQVERMLAGTTYDIESLTDDEVEHLDKCRCAKEILGTELCIDAINAVPSIQRILLALDEFQQEYARVEEISHIVDGLAPHQTKQRICHYWKAYCRSVWFRHTDEYIAEQLAGTEVYDFLNRQDVTLETLASHLLLSSLGSSRLEVCIDLVNWIASDLKALANNAVSRCLNQKNQRGVEVLHQRSLGRTLEEIGAEWDITRERVRQMEAKAIRLFVATFRRCQCEIILTISALCDGTSVIRKEQLKNCLDRKNADILWYILDKGDLNGEYYQFDDDIKAVIIGTSDPVLNIEKAVDELPESMFVDEAEARISELAGKDIHVAELLRTEIDRKYKKNGQYLHRGRLTVVEICDYILKTRFPNGYKIADKDYEKQFRRHMLELFGEVKGLPSGHSIDAKMAEVGFLCDRGKYIHPSAISIDPSIVDRINEYISSSPRTVLTFGEIYDALKEGFIGTDITNKYIMQGALNRFGCLFITRRDYVTKESSSNVAEEITLFIKTKGKIHKSALEDEFAVDDTRLGQVLARCPEIIALSAGYYIHSDLLVVSPEEVDGIRKYLKTTCAEAPVSTRAMLNDFNMHFTDFVINNEIEFHGNLFGILQYLYRDEFHFSRPFISMEDIGSMTSRSVLLTHMDGIDTIELTDLNDMCESIGIRFLTQTGMLAAIQPEYIRINETTLMRNDLVGITDDVVVQVEENIRSDLQMYRFRPTNQIEDFSWYPEVKVNWNPFLVESVMMLSNDQIASARIPMGVSTLPSFIFLSEEFADEDYTSFVIRILKEEHLRDPFSSISQVLTWLIDNGLCYKKLPAFLEDGNHLYTDENGLFRVE